MDIEMKGLSSNHISDSGYKVAGSYLVNDLQHMIAEQTKIGLKKTLHIIFCVLLARQLTHTHSAHLPPCKPQAQHICIVAKHPTEVKISQKKKQYFLYSIGCKI